MIEAPPISLHTVIIPLGAEWYNENVGQITDC